ncbi:MAG: rhamnogalacturonan lyase, partial [Clostridia bacterium]|nr:rhamnogalacturonan lyase [Clostridia bacterium]
MSFAVMTTQAEEPAKQMEYLDRGTVAVVTGDGVYISWRLLGSESLSNQAFDIYRDGTKIYTTGVHDATCYTDTSGTASNTYAVVPAGTKVDGEKTVTPWTTNVTNSVNVANSIAHIDLAFTAPSDGVTPGGETYTYSVNDMSVGDLDGDGEYELVVKWDPSLAKDNSQTGYTGEVYMDAYELDGTRMWRMNLGPNIRAGAHYTQFLVYDFDGDGRSEVVLKTAPGSKDGNGRYVSAVGKDIGEINDSADYRSDAGLVLEGPEYLTVFYGETGEAMQTVLYDPPRSINTTGEWGDGYGNRCERYLAGVAYLDGKTPSIIEVRGYYTYAYVAAYTWDGTNLTEQWLSSNSPDSNTVTYANGTSKTTEGKTLYGQGAHSLSVADVDNDNYDEIIFGSAILDHDGTVLLYDGRGHGDAEHVSDFDNDGQQEIFMVHEAGKGSENTIDFAVDVKRYNGDVVLQAAVGDIGRGVMANVDDAYAQQSGDLSLFWSVASENAFNQKGESVGAKPGAANFLVYWDGDLSREILDDNKLSKYTVDGGTGRFYYDRSTSWLDGASSNNGTKATPGLVADIFGDWREEMVFTNGSGARIFFSTLPTEYRLHTLMHDSQYRCAVAWQNVAYNQPPHQSYYIGSAALAKSGSTTLNYLAPASGFDTIEYPDTTSVTPRPT